jgi:lysophospholipase L1-like esterase
MTAPDLSSDALARSIVSLGDASRLHRVLDKARRGEPIVVGFIGGSITQGACASTPADQYCNRVVEMLRERLTPASITLVNAGRGATGSNYGSLRAQRDLLIQSPDLVVLEFAVNDGVDAIFGETFEGLLRQVLASPAQPAALMLFMMHRGGRNAQDRLGAVGRHYGVPMTSYRDALWPEIEAGRLTWEDISPDEVHPNDLGHAIAARCVVELFDRVAAQSRATSIAPLPTPLHSDAFEHTHLHEATSLVPVSAIDWTLESHGDPWPYWSATTPGSVIEFEVEGTTILLMYYRRNAPLGRAMASVDGGPAVTLDAWFEQTWGGYRETTILARNLAPGRHRVTVRVTSDRNAGSTGDEFRILGLGTAGVSR